MTDWNNKEEVLEAVREDGHALKQASEDLRADKVVVMAAVDPITNKLIIPSLILDLLTSSSIYSVILIISFSPLELNLSFCL